MNDAVKGLVKALVLIKDHDGGFEKNRYVDEWTEAESFDECKKIAKNALNKYNKQTQKAVS